MRMHRIGLSALVLAASMSVAWAADPVAGTAPIKGSDALGDKGRSGPDGWSWAPQTRDQAPTDKTDATATDGRGALNSQPGAAAAKSLKPGEDPGTPVATDSHGPGTLDNAATRKP